MPDPNGSSATETAYLAGGCFWCIEAVFDDLNGVISTQSGYMGGALPNPSYEQVCSGRTGHAEVVRVTFDPSIISFEDILEVFFAVHDPTTLNRQGEDVGTQYRSEIFAANPKQAETAMAAIAKLAAEKAFADPIVTAVSTAGPFYQAEAYHDDFFKNNPWQGYCQVVVGPKVAKFRKQFAGNLKPSVAAQAH